MFGVILYHKNTTRRGKGKLAISFHRGYIEGPIKEVLQLLFFLYMLCPCTLSCSRAVPCSWGMQALSSGLGQSRSAASSQSLCFRKSMDPSMAFTSFYFFVVVSPQADGHGSPPQKIFAHWLKHNKAKLLQPARRLEETVARLPQVMLEGDCPGQDPGFQITPFGCDIISSICRHKHPPTSPVSLQSQFIIRTVKLKRAQKDILSMPKVITRDLDSSSFLNSTILTS